MKVIKVIGNCLFGFIAISLLVILFFTFINRGNDIPKIGSYSILEVEGTSMHPSIKNGDLIAIDRRLKDKYQVGDVVSFVTEDGSIITHEIVRVDDSSESVRYYTKGENNNYQDNDYIEIKHIIGEYKGFRIPLLGYVVGFGSTPVGYILLVVLPLGVITVLIGKELLKEISKKVKEFKS